MRSAARLDAEFRTTEVSRLPRWDESVETKIFILKQQPSRHIWEYHSRFTKFFSILYQLLRIAHVGRKYVSPSQYSIVH